ncbi:hypothetical protein HpBTM60_18530 [Helicobacter pylori]
MNFIISVAIHIVKKLEIYNNRKVKTLRTRPIILFLINIKIVVKTTNMSIVFGPKTKYKKVEGITIPIIEI